MEASEKGQGLITEAMVEQYFHLSKKAKEIEKELSKLKQIFHKYFDMTEGVNQKGELPLENYILLRQIRVSERFNDQDAVSMLEKMNLKECIRIEKRVDEEKVQAAATLGLIDPDMIEKWKERKYSSVIVVKER